MLSDLISLNWRLANAYGVVGGGEIIGEKV